MSRARLHIFLEPDHARRLQDLSVRRGVSKSELIAAALSAFLASPEAAAQRERAVVHRLDRLSGQFDRLERDQNLLIEALALYVRIYLSLSLPVPEDQQHAARAQGRARYAQYLDQLGRQIQRGHGLARELGEELDAATLAAGAPAPTAGAGTAHEDALAAGDDGGADDNADDKADDKADAGGLDHGTSC